MVVSCVLQLTSRTIETAAAGAATQVTMSSFEFSPGEYQVAPDTATSFQVHNSDAFTHNFVIEALDVNTLVPPGSQKVVEVTAPAGDYEILCTLHPDMEAKLSAK